MVTMKMRMPHAWLVVVLFTLPPQSAQADEVVLKAVKETGGLVSVRRDGGGFEIGFQHSGRSLTDEGMVHLASLKNVVVLNFRDTQITGAGLKHLKDLTDLRRLHLERTSVGDAGLKHIAGLTSLEYLNLYSTNVTDAGLAHLEGLKNLEQLYLWQTEVTDEGVDRLQRALPKLRIDRGIDLAKIDMTEKDPEPEPKVELTWMPATGEDPPNSKTGEFITVTFINNRSHTVKLYWVEYGGGLKHYGDIEAGAKRLQTTYSDASWVITDASDSPLGYFRTGREVALAVIPKD